MGGKTARRGQRPVRSAQTVVVEDETESKRARYVPPILCELGDGSASIRRHGTQGPHHITLEESRSREAQQRGAARVLVALAPDAHASLRIRRTARDAKKRAHMRTPGMTGIAQACG
jgi:hypothetical protein